MTDALGALRRCTFPESLEVVQCYLNFERHQDDRGPELFPG